MPDRITRPIACIGFSTHSCKSLQETFTKDFDFYFFESGAAFYNATRNNKNKFKAIRQLENGYFIEKNGPKAGFGQM